MSGPPVEQTVAATPSATNIKELKEEIQRESAFVDVITMEMDKVIVGQKHMVERLLVGLLSDGHIPSSLP